MQGNYLQFIFLLIIVGFSVASWIFRKLSEQAAKKRARDTIEQRQREILRTGRDPGEISVDSGVETQRKAEIAARREAQLAELRRRAQARQGGMTPTIGRIPGSSGPTVPPVRPSARPKAQARPQAKSSARPGKPARAAAARQPLVALPEHEGESSTHRLVPETAGPVMARAAVVAGVPQSAEDWRRAIIANEILSPPMSERSGPLPLPF